MNNKENKNNKFENKNNENSFINFNKIISQTKTKNIKIFLKKNKKIKKNKKELLKIYLLKFILIGLIIFGFYYTNNSFSNTIQLLAVSENSKGEINGGSLINLSLKIKPGNGEIYVNLNSIEEVDTQISIINSQKIACDIFNLDCQNYDFYYEFSSSSIILKGPSASTAIAILTAKTVKKEKIKEKETVITGSLNSGGLIGNVGGITQKILVAKQNKIKKVLIPIFSTYNKTKDYSKIKIIKTIDLVEAYNNFNGKKYEQEKFPLNKENYQNLMKKLAKNLCERTIEIKNQINLTTINKNSSLYPFLNKAVTSYNSSQKAYKIKNYYSMGSFCYNANINFRIILENIENNSPSNLNKKTNLLYKEIKFNQENIFSEEYKKKIQTINDFYVYLLLNNRINEAKNFLKEYNKIKYLVFKKEKSNDTNNSNNSNKNKLNLTEINKIKLIINNSIYKKTNISNLTKYIKNNYNITLNFTKDNLNLDYILNNINQNIIDKENIKNETKIYEDNLKIYKEKINYYSFAKERMYTVKLWEKFITHTGTKVKFNDKKIIKICRNTNKEILIKNELLKKYNLNYLESAITEQNNYNLNFTNQYLCIYNGLELNGRINTLLNSRGIKDNNSMKYIIKLNKFTKSKLPLNSKGDFPLLPYIYSEYAEDLFRENNTGSTILYSNYALSYLDLNYLLKEEKNNKSIFNQVINESYNNLIFLTGLLLLISFIGI